jgi:signal transduction histidine kinase
MELVATWHPEFLFIFSIIMKTIARSVSARVITLLLFTMTSLPFCFSQNPNTADSLLHDIQKMQEDSFKANKLLTLCNILLRSGDYIMCRQQAEEVLSLSKKINFPKGMAFGNNYIGLTYKNQGDYSEALDYYSRALNIWEEMGDRRNIAGCHINFGTVYALLGNYTEALNHYNASLIVCKELGFKKGIAYNYDNMGIIYKNQGQYAKALDNYSDAIKIFEALGDKYEQSGSYNNLAIVYEIQGNYTEALKNALTSLSIAEETGNRRGASAAYSEIGNIYNKQNDYTEALKNYSASLTIAEEIGDKSGVAGMKSNIGTIDYRYGHYQEALDNFTASLKIHEEIGDVQGVSNSYHLIGSVYYAQEKYTEALQNNLIALKLAEELGDQELIATINLRLGEINIKMLNTTEAKKYLDEALSVSFEVGLKDIIPTIYRSLATLDSLNGNDQQALVHYKLYSTYKDSVLNESNSKMLAEMKTSYETEKKDKEIQKLESEKQIHSLQFSVQQESLKRTQTENEKIQAENLLNLSRVDLLANEKKLQELEIEKNQADLTAQKTETEKREAQVALLNQQSLVQNLEISRQKQLKNYLLWGLLLFGILGFFAYNNYITRQKLKLLTLRNKIASDLHDDVGSTLSSISIFTQMAQQQSKDVYPMLETIGEHSRKMLEAMADIVWTINPENDQFEKIILRMRSFAYELLGAKQIEFEFDADDHVADMKLAMNVRKNLFLIFKEATNNLVKYSHADKVFFMLRGDKHILTMMIRDNGKGFDTHSFTQGNGLRNMKKRAEEIGGALIIDSMPGSGTTIQLKVAV